jgi:hypothetical protein
MCCSPSVRCGRQMGLRLRDAVSVRGERAGAGLLSWRRKRASGNWGSRGAAFRRPNNRKSREQRYQATALRGWSDCSGVVLQVPRVRVLLVVSLLHLTTNARKGANASSWAQHADWWQCGTASDTPNRCCDSLPGGPNECERVVEAER